MWGRHAGASVEQLVLEVKEYQKTNLLAKAKWIAFTAEHGGGNRDPARHTQEFLLQFLNQLLSEEVDLVGQVKELQKGDLATKEAWTAYVEAHGEGNRDPARHTHEFLQGFLAFIQSGEKISSEGGTTILQAIKTMQSRSTNFKNAWALFCSEKGHGKRDPAQHDMAFYIQFFEDVARYAGDGGAAAAPIPLRPIGGGGGSVVRPKSGGLEEPLAKKLRAMIIPPASAGGPGIAGKGTSMGAFGGGFAKGTMGNGKGPVTGGATIAGKGHSNVLAERVKAFQRMGEMQKNAWWTFADANLAGTRDPARADVAALSRFIASHDVPPLDEMCGGAMGSTVTGGLLTPKVSAGLLNPGLLTPKRPAGGNLISSLLTGGTAPGIMPGQAGSMTGMIVPGGSLAEKADLVQRVKAFQKQGGKDVWAQFAGGTRDPMKQPVERLMEFCESMGI